jgi:hypothetical protein
MELIPKPGTPLVTLRSDGTSVDVIGDETLTLSDLEWDCIDVQTRDRRIDINYIRVTNRTDYPYILYKKQIPSSVMTQLSTAVKESLIVDDGERFYKSQEYIISRRQRDADSFLSIHQYANTFGMRDNGRRVFELLQELFPIRDLESYLSGSEITQGSHKPVGMCTPSTPAFRLSIPDGDKGSRIVYSDKDYSSLREYILDKYEGRINVTVQHKPRSIFSNDGHYMLRVGDTDYDGDDKGYVICSFPVTYEIAQLIELTPQYKRWEAVCKLNLIH